MTPTAIYRAIMLAVDERRQALGLSMWQVDEGAGTQEGYYAKALHADAPSGRQAQWATLQLIVEYLFPEGFTLRLEAAPSSGADDAPSFKRKLRHITASFNPKSRRELMSELGRRGVEIQRQIEAQKPGYKSRIIRKAWRTRRRRMRERRTLAEAAPDVVE